MPKHDTFWTGRHIIDETNEFSAITMPGEPIAGLYIHFNRQVHEITSDIHRDFFGTSLNPLPEGSLGLGVALGFRLAFNDRSIVTHPARRNWSELVRKWDRIIAERRAGYARRGMLGDAAWIGVAILTALSAGAASPPSSDKRRSCDGARQGGGGGRAREDQMVARLPHGGCVARRLNEKARGMMRFISLFFLAGICVAQTSAAAAPAEKKTAASGKTQVVAKAAGREITLTELRLEMGRLGLAPSDPNSERLAYRYHLF